jgi:hypothetical protein
MLRYKDLKKRPKELLAATGLKADEFEALLAVFAETYEASFPEDQTMDGKPRQRRRGGGGKATLVAMEDKLLFILVYEKTYPLQTMLGLQFGLSQGRANIWIHRLLPVVRQALARMKLTPVRDGQAVAESELASEGGADLVIDGTERRRQRPQDEVRQRAQYSGKKKAHTDKNLVVVNCHNQKVVYLSPTQPGKKHDKKLADEAAITYPPGATLGKDTGFQGYEPPGVVAWQPKKKTKGQDLTVVDKSLNRLLSTARIVVEHTLAGVKRCHSVKDLFRNTKEGLTDLVMEVACALHNLRVDFRHPVPTVDLLTLVG